VFIIDDENAWNWWERHIDPLSSIFRAWQKRCQRGTRAGVLQIFTEPQNTEELLEGQYGPSPDPRTGQFCSLGVINEDQARRPKTPRAWQELYLAARFLRKKKAGAI
jgi:hypothetical protein